MTGFEPFDEVETNPSQLIVAHFAKQGHAGIITEVLPVEYEAAGQRIITLLKGHQPDIVMMLGVAQKEEQLNLERIAVNIDDATIPDNSGKHLTGKRIFTDAPVGYWSTLPLEALYEAISKAEIAVTFSNHAGAFLCNHVFYVARHTLELLGRGSVPSGFIHLPALEAMPIETQIKAIELCLMVVEVRTILNA
jgi:pyroglutamyl-peptidase